MKRKIDPKFNVLEAYFSSFCFDLIQECVDIHEENAFFLIHLRI